MCLANWEVQHEAFLAHERLVFQSWGEQTEGVCGKGGVGVPYLIKSCIVLKGGGKMPRLNSALFSSSQSNLQGKRKKKKPATKT